jgi:hypothetical protein
MIAPTWFADKRELGLALIVLGFVIGGLGFYLRFIRK